MTSLLMSKIIDISAARRRRERRREVNGMNRTEKRREFRRSSNDNLFVQIVSAPNSSLVGQTIACLALDVSPNGLRIQSEIPIPDGSRLDLWVDNSNGPGKFFLSSTVRWSTEVGERHEAGLELHGGAATDIELWRQQYTSH